MVACPVRALSARVGIGTEGKAQEHWMNWKRLSAPRATTLLVGAKLGETSPTVGALGWEGLEAVWEGQTG